ncbi:MAG: hypothetical protein AB1405_10665 [Bdellovibrionota bacterium]
MLKPQRNHFAFLSLALVTLSLGGCAGMLGSKAEYRAQVALLSGVPEGDFRLLNESGAVQATGAYKQGEKDGVWRYYTSQGKLFLEVQYVAGKKDGPCRMWFSDPAIPVQGEGLKLTMNYLKGFLHGPVASYYPSGAKRSLSEYKLGVLVATQHWAPEGAVLSSKEANAGEEHDRFADQRLFDAMDDIVRTAVIKARLGLAE